MHLILLPVLETTRLLLRPIELTDAEAVFEYAASPLVGPNAGWKPHQTIEEAKQFINYCIKKRDFGQPGNYAVVLKETNTMIGTCEIHSYKDHKGEIGFVLHPGYWNKGIMTEAAKAVIVYGFEVLKLKRLAYGHFVFNDRSKRVCEKLGFTFEGILRKKYMSYDGTALDEAIYSIIDDDYLNGKIPWLEDFRTNTLKDSSVDYKAIK